MAQSKISQSKWRNTKFSHDQYWSLSYTEVDNQGGERDFKTIIKSRSAALAREILEERLKEDPSFNKIRSVTVSMIHKTWLGSAHRRSLSISEWKSIRNISFPNDWNRVFKFEKKRIKGQKNRFNVPSRPLTGEHKKALRKAANKLVDTYVRGSFRPLCPALKKLCNQRSYYKKNSQRKGFASLYNKDQAAQELAFLKNLMKECGGNLAYAADTLKVGRSSFYRALKRFPEVDWHEEFPLTYQRVPEKNSMACPEARAKLAATLKRIGHRPPLNKKGTPSYKKWKRKITATWSKKQKEIEATWKKKLIRVLRDNDHKRAESAEALGITVPSMTRIISNIAKKDPAFKAEFMYPELSLRLKIASTKKRRHENRLKFLKENKHLILQAYYQNGQSDCAAAKALKMDTRTVTKAREEIEKYEI